MSNIKQKTDYPFFDEEFNEVWEEYKLMRKKIRKPMTDYAERLALRTLERLAGQNKELAMEIINQSIESSWQGLFPLTDERKKDMNIKQGKPWM